MHARAEACGRRVVDVFEGSEGVETRWRGGPNGRRPASGEHTRMGSECLQAEKEGRCHTLLPLSFLVLKLK